MYAEADAHHSHQLLNANSHTLSLSQVDVVVPNTHYTTPCFVWPGFVHGRVWGKGCVGGGGARCRGDTAITRVSLFVVGWSCPDGWALNVFVGLGVGSFGSGGGGGQWAGVATRLGRGKKASSAYEGRHKVGRGPRAGKNRSF